MQSSILIFGLVAAGAGMLAVFAVYAHAFLTSRDPTDDPPRAFAAELLGLWIAGLFLISSFAVDNSIVAWILRFLAFFSVVMGLYLRTTFLHTNGVPEPPNRQPSSTENETTDLHRE